MANELKRSKRIIMDKIDINPDNLKLYEKYERDMEIRELSVKSIKGYKSDLFQWFHYIAKEQFNQKISDLNEEDLEEFIYYCKQEGNNTERIKRRLSSISALYKFLKRKKIITENPTEFLIRPKKGLPVVVQTYLTKEQVALMKQKLKEHGDLRLECFVLVGLTTMARVNALSNLKWEQVDFENRTIDGVLEKEGKIVSLYFNEEAKEKLLELQKVSKSEYIFDGVESTTMDMWIKKVGQMIGVPTLHCHDLRHTYATLLKNNGMPIEQISTLLNHSGLDVTKKHYIAQDKRKIQDEKDKFDI